MPCGVGCLDASRQYDKGLASVSMMKLYAAHDSAPYLTASVLLSACVLALSTSAATDDGRSFALVVSSAAPLTVGFGSQENGPGRGAEPAGSAASDEEP